MKYMTNINYFEQWFWNNLLDLPAKLYTDDGLEEVVDDFDEVCRVDDETGLQVLPIPKNNCLYSKVTN